MIAFVGSVFSPYYRWARRREPENHVCINVALYAPGANRWSMTERGRAALTRERTCLRIGPSALQWRGGVLSVDFDELSPPWPGTNWLPRRIRGQISFRPQFTTGEGFRLDAEGRHWWQPIAPAGRIEIETDEAAQCWRGNGYFDSNWGAAGLEQDFSRWDWARTGREGGGATVLYWAEMRGGGMRDLGLAFDGAGRVELFGMPESQPLTPGFWRVRRGIPADAGTGPETLRMLEDSPFYARALVETTVGGETARYMHESFDGPRFASPLVRAMLPFRMPRRGGSSS